MFVAPSQLLFAYPDAEQAINAFSWAVMRGPSSLAPAERELIAAFVSSRNGCQFCSYVHEATARNLLGNGAAWVDAALIDPKRVSPKLSALLAMAERIRCGQALDEEDVGHARAAGADDRAIHDVVLVAAMISMMNRYVDGFGRMPIDPATCDEIAARRADPDSLAPDEPILLDRQIA
jgi:uncharacterized peroxidase-related enzyme